MEKEPTNLELLLALYLIDYYRYSFSVRSQGILYGDSVFDPPEVRELLNVIMWHGGGMSDDMRYAHGQGLNTIIKRNADKVRPLISRVREGNMSKHILEEIDQLNMELYAANAMMEYIGNDHR